MSKDRCVPLEARGVDINHLIIEMPVRDTATPREGKHRAGAVARPHGPGGWGQVAGHRQARRASAIRAQTLRESIPAAPVTSTYLALPRHADGRAVLAAGGAVNDLLRLPDVEAVPHCLAVQFTLPIALYFCKWFPFIKAAHEWLVVVGRTLYLPDASTAFWTHIGVAQLVLAVGPDAGDCRGSGGLGEARCCPVGSHAMVAACFRAVKQA